MAESHAPDGELNVHFVTPGSAFAVVAVTAAGLLCAASSPSSVMPSHRLALVVALGVLHALLGTAALAVVERHGRRAHLHVLIAVALAASLVALAVSGGSTYLLLMSIISQSVLYLPRTGVALVVGACLAATVVLHALHAPDALDVVKHLVAFGSFTAFVIVFSGMMREQHRARADLERLAEKLGKANELLRGHAADVEELATTKERNRIAREIHDGLGHYLTVVHVQLEAALTMLRRDPDRAQSALAKAQELTREGLGEIRRSVAVLRGSGLDDRVLLESIRKLAGECVAQGIEAEVRFSGTERRLAESIEAALYRTAQEALTNVRRHARASRLTIELAFTARDRVKLSVVDDGVGTDGVLQGFGLLGLRERAALVGGTLSIRTEPGRGFTLEMEVPG